MSCDVQEVVKMRAACKLAAQVLQYAGTLVKVSSPFHRLHIISQYLLACTCLYAQVWHSGRANSKAGIVLRLVPEGLQSGAVRGCWSLQQIL